MTKKVSVLAFDWTPQCEVERPIAREMVDTGEYGWCNSSRAIRSLKWNRSALLRAGSFECNKRLVDVAFAARNGYRTSSEGNGAHE